MRSHAASSGSSLPLCRFVAIPVMFCFVFLSHVVTRVVRSCLRMFCFVFLSHGVHFAVCTSRDSCGV